MKIIRIKDIRIVMKDRTTYSIQSPIGVFKNINDAIEQYPYLTEDNKISQCPICGDYFIKYGKGDNNRKYCSEECSETYRRIYLNEWSRMYQRDKWLRESKQTLLNDWMNRSLNWEFHQDDRFWGLGESHLYEHPRPDFKHEENAVKMELNRIFDRKNNKTY